MLLIDNMMERRYIKKASAEFIGRRCAMSDLEHDTQEEFGGAVGAAPKPPPEQSDSELDKLDAMQDLTEKRKRERTLILADRKAMLAARYHIRPQAEEKRLAAANAEWNSLDNEALWTE